MQDEINAFTEFVIQQLRKQGVSREEVKQGALATIRKDHLKVLLDQLEEGHEPEK
jgi:hypothetical protein